MPSTRTLSLALLLLCLPRTSAHAESLLALPTDPMNLQADKVEIEINAGNAVLSGNVLLSKGDLSVRCARVDVKFDTTPHIRWAKGSGGVTADVRGVHAEAPDVEFDVVRQTLELRGG